MVISPVRAVKIAGECVVFLAMLLIPKCLVIGILVRYLAELETFGIIHVTWFIGFCTINGGFVVVEIVDI